MAQFKEKPKLVDFLKVGLVFTIARLFVSFILAFLGIAIVLSSMTSISAIQALGLLMFAIPILWLIDGALIYFISKWGFSR